MSADNKNKNRVKSSLLYSLYAVLSLILVFILMLSIFPGFMFNVFGFRAYVSHYDQMEPTIKSNALVFINKVNLDDLNENDLVTFESNSDLNNNGKNDLITGYFNRMSGTGEDAYYYFRSEGSLSDWAVIKESSVVGGYAFSIPVLGLIVDFIGSPFGIAVIFVNLAIVGGIIYIVKHNNHQKKEIIEDKHDQDSKVTDN